MFRIMKIISVPGGRYSMFGAGAGPGRLIGL